MSELEDLKKELESYKTRYERLLLRLNEIQKIIPKLPNPWNILVADILANGHPRTWGEGKILFENKEKDTYCSDCVHYGQCGYRKWLTCELRETCEHKILKES